MPRTRGVHRVEVLYQDGSKEVFDHKDWTIYGTHGKSPIPFDGQGKPVQATLVVNQFTASRRETD